MKRLLILDNEDSFSYNLRHLFKPIPEVEVVVKPTSEFVPQDLDDIHAVILSPGPGLPDDHKNLKLAISLCEGRLPLLGVCLGHQAIAEYFGGELYRLNEVLHGIKSELTIHDDSGIWNGMATSAFFGRYHSYMVKEDGFPSELMITAADEEGRIMSLRHQVLPIYGVQFHPESYLSKHGAVVAENFINLISAFHD